MIIHYNHDKPAPVYVVNSRHPVYREWYGDGLGDIIAGLFTRMAPKVAPLAKQLSMKAIDVIRDKGISAGASALGNLAGRALSAAKDKITSLVKRRKQPGTTPSLILPSTTAMPASVSKAINAAVEEKLESLAAPLVTKASDTQTSAIMNAIAGSGLKQKRKRRR